MADKAKELEERLDRLENRLKTTFLEVEKRFEEMRGREHLASGPEDRIAELEDLLLLLQLEVTKIKESAGTGLEFGATAEPQSDVMERLKKMEDFLASHEAVDETPEARGAMERLVLLERKIAAMESHTNSDKGAASSMGTELDIIEKRLERLEEGRSGGHRTEYKPAHRTEHKPLHRKEHRPLQKHSKDVHDEKEKIRREQNRLQEKIMQRKSVLEDVRKILQSS